MCSYGSEDDIYCSDIHTIDRSVLLHAIGISLARDHPFKGPSKRVDSLYNGFNLPIKDQLLVLTLALIVTRDLSTTVGKWSPTWLESPAIKQYSTLQAEKLKANCMN